MMTSRHITAAEVRDQQKSYRKRKRERERERKLKREQEKEENHNGPNEGERETALGKLSVMRFDSASFSVLDLLVNK